MGDVLDNLNPQTVEKTIQNPSSPDSYDLNFFLPLFSHLLAAENAVQTYRFSKSGALALTITGLRGSKEQILIACHVLSRFHYHLEAKHSGKDNLLWLRFVEAVCKGSAVLPDFQLNHFAGIFLAKSALILSQPGDVLYVPLSQYFAAKDLLDFSTIPELYTFLHGPDVNAKDLRSFILEVIKHGLISDRDVTIFLKSMAFKLISELGSSLICDYEDLSVIFDVFQACCRIDLGVKVLCGNLAFLTQVFGLFIGLFEKKSCKESDLVFRLLQVLLVIVKSQVDRHRCFLIYFNLIVLIEDFFQQLGYKCLQVCYQILLEVVEKFPDFVTNDNLLMLLDKTNDKFCCYMFKYGCEFLKTTDFSVSLDKQNYLHLLFYKKLKK